MRLRYLLGFLIVVGVIILAIILIVKALSSPSSPTPQPLVDYAGTDTTVQLLIDGPVVANQDHRAVQITVGQGDTAIQVLKGYQGSVMSSKTYANNQAAYAVFLRSIDLLGFTKGNSSPSLSDYRGYCPQGDRYVFEIINGGGETTQSYWSTSCGGQGSFAGNTNDIVSLFQSQIHDYDTLTNGVQL